MYGSQLSKKTLAVVALTAAVFAQPARAVLQDFGPINPATGFPTWYRDLNGNALQSCLSTSDSPNAPGFPMCFPIAPNPQGFPGNLGDEFFYSDLTMAASGPGFDARYIAALESAYANGTPKKGDEVVFARIRIVMNVTVPGTYKVTHPYGVEVFPDVQPGPRAVFFTEDIGLAPGIFNLALTGRVGPFPQWDFVNFGESLTVTTPAGATEQFLGDPNVDHTFVGSPFGTNYLRVDGPPGSNISGIGDDFVQTPLGAVLGQLYLTPIPTPVRVTRSSYNRDAAGVTSVNVFATSRPGVKLLVSGTNLPTTEMLGDGSGKYVAHVELAPGVLPPASILVTNVTDVPASSVPASITDIVNVTSATFDTLTATLSVAAQSSDLLAPPALTVAGPFGGPMTSGAFSGAIAGIWPQQVTVVSSAGGNDTAEVIVLPNLLNLGAPQPVAVPDAIATDMNVAVTFDPTANDAIAAPAGASYVVLAPAHGTATSGAAGAITYRPALNYFGPDSFQYVVQDASGLYTNIGTVTVDVRFVAAAPTANTDSFALLQNKAGAPTSRRYNVVANDFAATATTINPASVTVTTLPLHGTVVANGDGTVTYTPVVGYVGADSYRYTVANTAGAVSTPATVNIVVEGGNEALSIAKADYRVSTALWTIVGSTNWFGPTLTTTTVTCYVGRGTAGLVIGTQLVDTAGKFQLVPAVAPPPDATNIATCQSSNGGTISFAVTRR